MSVIVDTVIWSLALRRNVYVSDQNLAIINQLMRLVDYVTALEAIGGLFYKVN
jgi:hypothetical protein